MKTGLLKAIQDQETGISSKELCEKLGTERHTLTKYLESLESTGKIQKRQFGRTNVWYPVKAQILSILEKDDDLATAIKNLLSQFEEKVTILSPDKQIIWSNVEKAGTTCQHGCQTCPAEQTVQTGCAQKSIEKSKEIQTVPIKDAHGNTVAILEKIREL